MKGNAAHERRLSKARRTRSRMTSELRALSSGQIHITDVLVNPPDALGRCHVYDVLRRTPKLGDEGAKSLCVRFKLWPYDKLSSIPLEQRKNLFAALPERVKNYPTA